MKRLLTLILIPMLLLSGCVNVAQPEPEAAQIEGKLIYASFYPLYALSERIVRGVPNMVVKVLVQPQDGCLRNYELSEWDIAKIASCDAMIVGGRGLETFESALMNQEDGGVAAIGAMNGLTLIGQGGEVDGELESHLQGGNPWLFLSTDGAEQIMESIAGGMAGLDPGFEGMYADNLERGQEALQNLRQDCLEALVRVAPQPVALLHEGLVYLAEDLGLNVVCQVDREPGTELYDNDLSAAIDEMNAAGAKVVLVEKQAPDQLKQALKAAGFRVALIDTLSTFPIGAGFDHYLKAMKGNARAVADAFAGVRA